MTTSITIPNTVEAAKQQLGGIGKLLTAKQWERAAIVYAFTAPQKNQNPLAGNAASGKVSFTDFAAFGFLGLADRGTVADYHMAWQTAIDTGKAGEVKPGDTITLPDLDWPPTGHTTGSTTEKSARAYIARNPAVAVEAMKAVPAVAEAVVIAVADDPDLADMHARASFAHKPGTGLTRIPKPSTPTIITSYDYEKRLSAAISVVSEAIEAEKAGTWKPGPGEAAMLTILFLALRDRADRYAAAQPAVHGEINDFLATTRKQED